MSRRRPKRWQELRDEILFPESPPGECPWCRQMDEQQADEARAEAALVREVEDYLRSLS